MHRLAPLLLLAACASPGMGFRDSPRTDLTLDGMNFSVFRAGDEVQVIRLGWLPLAQRDRVPALMMRAAEQATGCRAVEGSLRHQLPGDTAEGKLRVDC